MTNVRSTWATEWDPDSNTKHRKENKISFCILVFKLSLTRVTILKVVREIINISEYSRIQCYQSDNSVR
jgi:hypothetical protein